jgi:5'-phosphate synthase pdxT subunit
VTPRIGVLALQGDFKEHVTALAAVGTDAVEVRTAGQLAAVDALIIPGGESTSMAKLMDLYALREPLRAFALDGHAVWGTCAGLILLARELEEDRPEPLGLMDTLVRRNGFGRQVDSFETDLAVEGVNGGTFHAIFIRAPMIVRAGPGVRALATLADGTIVAARQENLLVTAFHPELASDTRMHRYFAEMTNANRAEGTAVAR